MKINDVTSIQLFIWAWKCSSMVRQQELNASLTQVFDAIWKYLKSYSPTFQKLVCSLCHISCLNQLKLCSACVIFCINVNICAWLQISLTSFAKETTWLCMLGLWPGNLPFEWLPSLFINSVFVVVAVVFTPVICKLGVVCFTNT